MKKAFVMTGAAMIAALGVQAQEADLAALQKQLNELSLKISQLEKDGASKASSIEQLQSQVKEDPVPQWVKDMKISGDFRYRYENIEVDGDNNADRQRVRLRLGITGKANDFIDYGVRVATGGASATSANQNIDGTTKKEIRLDQYYVKLHPEQLKGANVILGKMPQPWSGRTGLVWDGDLNPEGVAVTYSKQFEGVKLSANGGSFVITERKGDDVQLWAGQLVADTKVGDAKVQLGLSDFYFHKADIGGLAVNNNTANGDFHLLEGFGSVGFKVGDLPVAVKGQYVVNTEAADSNQDTAYLVGFTVGKAKDKGSWELSYDWRDVQRDAVVDAFNDSDFANGLTGHHGHALGAKYQVAKNMQAGATYLMAVNNAGDDVNTLQLDLNFKF
jgi:hypothetical protein